METHVQNMIFWKQLQNVIYWKHIQNVMFWKHIYIYIYNFLYKCSVVVTFNLTTCRLQELVFKTSKPIILSVRII